MLAGAGLFLRSLQEARRVSPGFSPNDVILATYEVSQLGYSSERGAIFHQQLLSRAASIPGVETATLAARVPLGFTPLRSLKVTIDGYVPAPGEDLVVGSNVIAPNYFRALRIPLQRGRDFSEHDRPDSEPVAIVNETMARRYWGARNGLGSSVRTSGRTLRIIGVAADSKYRALTEDPVPHLYLPAAQNYDSRMTLHLRTTANAEVMLPLLRAEAQRLDPALVLSNIQSLKTHMGFATLVPRMSASLLGAFGGLALFVATLGVYSIVAFVVASRRRELGVRLAVGASPRSISMLVIRYALNVAAWGVILGLVLAAGIGRLIAGLLVGVSPVDPLVFGGVVLLIVGAVLGAALVPAAEASRLDVMRILRS
jgi:predicted permease